MIPIGLEVIKNLSIYEILTQIVFIFKREVLLFCNRIHDQYFTTQITVNVRKRKEKNIIPDLRNLGVENINREIAREVCKMYLNHRFDLLGSGWVRCGFWDNAPGVQGYRYKGLVFQKGENWLLHVLDKKDYKRSKEIYNFISKEYEPIDWQKDYKTGYRWSAREWYRPIKIPKDPGVDIKVPWELARMQHLPRLALFYKMFPEQSEKIKMEYMNVCLDFIAQNPVRKGVNWMCTMDVAIRIANIVLAYWLFESFGVKFPKYFQQLIGNATYEHCKHIRNNLEWSVRIATNHYFANICGLLYGAAFLGDKGWINFARKQFKKELLEQFYTEGSNFEGSIGYHRLSGEMAVYTGALIDFLSSKGMCEPLYDMEKERLIRIGIFAKDTMAPDGSYVQIGDNDSGRFFNLTPLGVVVSCEEAIQKYNSLNSYQPEEENEMYFDEQVNSPKQLIAACDALKAEEKIESECIVERLYIRNLLDKHFVADGEFKVNSEKDCRFKEKELLYENLWEIVDETVDLREGMEIKQYPQFGVYVFRSLNLYMCVNVADNGQKGRAGHAHNDKLSFDLWINGKPVFQDPGTYLYTSILEERERFRSVKVHNTLQCNVEQNECRGTFSMSNDTKCTLLNFTESGIEVQVEFKDIVQRRKIQIYSHKIVITDSSNCKFTVNNHSNLLTNGYGKLLRKKVG